jgi:hypothetical protein
MRRSALLAALSTALLSGCVLTGGAHTESFVAQRDAISACIGTIKGTLPQGSQVRLDTTLRNGSYTVRVLPGGAISAADATAINACAQDRVASGGGAYPDPNTARARAEAELMQQYYGDTTPNGCPPRASVMYGGKQYCVGSQN